MDVLLQKVVERSYDLKLGGPCGVVRTLATFSSGETVVVRKVSGPGEYPDMYEIVGHPNLSHVSRGILCMFLPGFDRSTCTLWTWNL